MKKSQRLFGGLCGFIVGFALILSLPASLDAFSPIYFQTDMKLGMTSPSIHDLQVFLNQNPLTQISKVGIGSPGQESSYFGNLTKQAVITFQQIHGLPTTGFVGPLTRGKINAQTIQNIPPVPSQKSQSTATNNGSVSFKSIPGSQNVANVDTSLVSALRLYRVLPYQVRPGSTITISGDNLTEDGTLHIGDSYTTTLSNASKKGDFTAVVPQNVAEGTYNVWVTSNAGSSFRAKTPIKLVVTSNPQSAPTISSFSPQTISGGALGTAISVKGTGFSGNVKIFSRFGTISVSPTDSQSLSFKPADFSNVSTLKAIIAKKPSVLTYKVGFYVVTDAGVSSTAGTFIVQ